jgi:hypothetical protein
VITQDAEEARREGEPLCARFGIDKLSSAGCGPDAAVTVLLPLGAGLIYILPITLAIIVLLGIGLTPLEYPS